MKQGIIILVISLIGAFALCSCGENPNEIEIEGIGFTIPDEYSVNDDQDFIANSEDGVVKGITYGTVDAITTNALDDEILKNYAERMISELETEKPTGFSYHSYEVLDEGYPLLSCSYEASDLYAKVYFYCLDDNSVFMLEYNSDDKDFTDIDSVIKNASYENLPYSEWWDEDEEGDEEEEEQLDEPATEQSNTDEHSSDVSSMTELTEGDDYFNAWVCAQDLVKSSLKSPKSADFCRIDEAQIYRISDKQYMVLGYVDADNAYGASIRTRFSAWFTMTKKGYKDGYVEFDE